MTQISVDALTLVKLDKRFYDCLKYHGSVVNMKSSITPVCVYHLTTFLTQTCKTDNMTSDERFHKNTNILNSVRWSHAITYIKYTHGPMHTQTVSSLFQSAVFTGSSVKEKCKLILFHSPQSAVCVCHHCQQCRSVHECALTQQTHTNLSTSIKIDLLPQLIAFFYDDWNCKYLRLLFVVSLRC